MSGGSFNYLCNKDEAYQIMENKVEVEDMAQALFVLGYDDIAKDVRRLYEYIRSAEIRIEALAKILKPVFHAVEWYESSDYGKEELERELEKYRKCGVENG